MHHPTDRITHTTAFVAPVVKHWLEREIAQWVHPMKDRSDDPEQKKGNVLFNNILNTFHSQICSIRREVKDLTASSELFPISSKGSFTSCGALVEENSSNKSFVTSLYPIHINGYYGIAKIYIFGLYFCACYVFI